MLVSISIFLFLIAAVAEIGGAWLVWQGVREDRGLVWIGAGVLALGVYGFVATLQPDANFGRILAAYGGVFVAGGVVSRRTIPRGGGGSLEVEAGLADVRASAGNVLAAATAEELLLIASFIRRPPPELSVVALERDAILTVANGVALAA